MKTVAIWLQATRPKTLIVTLASVCIGIALSLSEGHFDLGVFLCTLGSALCIQIGTNLANDYFDFLKGADTETRKGPIRATASGLVSQKQMKIALALAFALAAIFAIPLIQAGGFPMICLLAASIALGILYTYGPFSLAYTGLGDLFVFVFFGPVAVSGTVYLQTQLLTADAILVGIAPGALSTAILALNNLRDIDEDRAANKKTLAVRFGTQCVKWECVLLITAAAAVPLLFIEDHPFALLALCFLLPAWTFLKALFQSRTPEAYSQLFFKTPRLLLIYTFLFCLGWML